MKANVRALAVGILGAAVMSGCATKGYVNRTVDKSAALQTAALSDERIARMNADSAMMRDLAALRTDLQSLRTEFGAKITAMEEGMKFAFPVHFAFDDASVREQDRAALERFAKVAQRYYPNARITVEGFSDPAGSPRYNLNLSQRRANAVREYLVAQGLSDQLLHTVGYGETRLVRPGAAGDVEGAQLNRRVVFVVETPADAAEVTAMSARPPVQD